jgi:hypothetical protein
MEAKDQTMLGDRVVKLSSEHLLLTSFSSYEQKKFTDMFRIQGFYHPVLV